MENVKKGIRQEAEGTKKPETLISLMTLITVHHETHEEHEDFVFRR
jgi:hypothetical protein